MKERYLECGKIVGFHGLKGEIKLLPWGDNHHELCEFKHLYLKKGETELNMVRARIHKNTVLITLEGYNSIEEAQPLRGKVVYIDREQDTLEDGQYYVQDLLGLEVSDIDTGEIYGKLDDVIETGANDVYYIKCPDGTDKLIPAIPQVVIDVDMEKETMRIRPLDGLFDD